jgi:transketolase C-terminal domain/subunit
VLRLGVPTQFVPPGSQDELLKIHGLDVDGVLTKIRAFWKLDA